jgi:hypothetical protein
MNAPARLSLYGAGLAALFVAAFVAAGAIVPQSAVAAWTKTRTQGDSMEEHGTMTTSSVRGVSLEQDGILLSTVTAPGTIGEPGTLSFELTTTDGTAVTRFETEHGKKLHLIVVRSDGSRFRHVHPTMSTAGVWSIPWTWDAAGSYRVFADVVPAATGKGATLTRTVDVAGTLTPEPATAASTTDTVDGYTVTLAGTLSSSDHSTLIARVSRDGRAVTALEPYLAAYGHLVALREGDLAYLHVHPEGEEPKAGSTSGPDIRFMAQAPTPGRYLLYLDFQVGGVVRTAHFVIDTTDSAPRASH